MTYIKRSVQGLAGSNLSTPSTRKFVLSVCCRKGDLSYFIKCVSSPLLNLLSINMLWKLHFPMLHERVEGQETGSELIRQTKVFTATQHCFSKLLNIFGSEDK